MTLVAGWTVTIDDVEGLVTSAVLADGGESIVFTVSQADGSPVEDGQEVVLSYDKMAENASIESAEGVALESFSITATNGSTYQIPNISTVTVEESGSVVSIVFNHPVTNFSTSGFSIVADGDAVALLSAHLGDTSVSGYFIVDAIYDDAVVTVTHEQDTTTTVSVNGGAALRDYSAAATNNSTRLAPTVTYGEVSSSGKRVDVYLSERVDGTASLGWTLHDTTYSRDLVVAGYAFTANNTADDGVRFTLTTPVYADSVITLSYSATTGDLVSHANNLVEVATFSDAAVVNHSALVRVDLTAAEYDDHSVVLTMSRPLFTTGTPTGFALTLNGDALSITTASYGPLGTQITLEFAEGVYDGDALVLDITSSNVLSTAGEETNDVVDFAVDTTAAPVFTPGAVTGALDYASWKNTALLAKETTGAWGVTAGDYVQRWKGELGAVSFNGPTWSNKNTSDIYYMRYYYTSTGVRGPLNGASIDFEAAQAITYSEPLVLLLAVRFPASVGGAVAGSLTASATGATILSSSISQTLLSSLRNGSAAASSLTVTSSYPQERHTVVHATDATNWGIDDGVSQDTNTGGAPGTTNATKLVLRMASISSTEGNPDDCPRILAWAAIRGTITSNERARLHAWLDAQTAV